MFKTPRNAAFMGPLFGLSLCLFGCDLLPKTTVSCDGTSRCAPVVEAPFVLGQPDAQTNWLIRGLYTPAAVSIVGNKLVVGDFSNHRVLIWNTFPTQSDQPADQVLGRPLWSTPYNNVPNGTQLSYPAHLASDGTRLVVSNIGGSNGLNALSYFNQFPTKNVPTPDFVVAPGNPPMAVNASTFVDASPLLTAGGYYVSDRLNNRILLWNSPPTGPTPADMVIGQASFAAKLPNSPSLSASTFNAPAGLANDGTLLAVADSANHRVLIWKTLPTAAMTPADLALGQATLISNLPNGGMTTPSLSTLKTPVGVAMAAGRIAVADSDNHRVLLWNQLPTTSGQAADVILGQPSGMVNAVNAGGAVSAVSMNQPLAVATDGTRLVVADTSNHRVLIWTSWPTSSGTAPQLVLGQQDLTSNHADGQFVSSTRFVTPVVVTRAGSHLLVVDRDANRVLIWPGMPTHPNEEPSVVLGQPNMTSWPLLYSSGQGPTSLYQPSAAASNGSILAVADTANNRVLIWNTLPSENQQPPDVVLGQPTKFTTMANNGGPGIGLSSPAGVYIYGSHLFVVDGGNQRVLIWNRIPSQNQQPPDSVLGQLDFNGIALNHGNPAPSATTLYNPTGVFSDGNRLYVSDSYYGRVLIWKTLEPTNGQAADLVLGQADFVPASSPPAAIAVATPLALSAFHGYFAVADRGYNRVALWKRLPTENGQPIDQPLGQLDINGSAPNNSGLNLTGLQHPSGVLLAEAGVYIADTDNGRVVVLPPLP